MTTTADIFSFRVRSLVVLVVASAISAYCFLWPFFLNAHSSAHHLNNQIFSLVGVPVALAVLIVEISDQRLDAKSVALLGVLAALAAALRPMGAGAVGIEPMWFLLILSARVFGPAFGFILGILAMFVSAVITGGFGPWLAYQMFAAGWVGLGAGLLPHRLGKIRVRARTEIAVLALYGIFASLAFGLLMDLQFWPWALGSQTQLSYIPGASIAMNAHRFIIYHFASSMAWDVPRAFVTSVLTVVTGPAVLFAMRRTKRRASFLTPIEFRESRSALIERVMAQREV
jgi:energy-coupling factor transport system substrate-specific component